MYFYSKVRLHVRKTNYMPRTIFYANFTFSSISETPNFVELLFKTLESQDYKQPSDVKDEEDGSRTPPTATTPQVSQAPIVETSNIVPLNTVNTSPSLHINGSAPTNAVKRETRKSESEKEEKEREKRPRSR